MFRGAKLIGNIIIILGIITLIAGIVIMLGLGSIFSGIKVTGAGQILVPILSIYTLATGSPIVLVSFLVMGFGELILLVSHIAERQ